MEAKSKSATLKKPEVSKTEKAVLEKFEDLKVDPSKKSTESEPKIDPETAKNIESDIELISKLEFYCAGPKFTEPINKFISEHANNFSEIDEETGYPVEYFLLYKEYTKLIDSLLESIFNISIRKRFCERK